MTIRIRYVERFGSYYIQHRTWYGMWKYATWSHVIAGEKIHHCYFGIDKEAMLREVLRDYFQVGLSFVKIIEHPTIRCYEINPE